MNEDKGSGGTPPEEEPHTVKPGTEGAAVGANSDEERTVIAPAAAGDEERTVVAPSGTAAQAAMPAGATSMPTFSNFAPRTDGQGIQVGDVLNHIFEVKRFLARGTADQAVEQLVAMTLERGAPDNVTVITVSFTEPTLLSLPESVTA